MKVVFADTGYWQAVLNPNDTLHRRAREVSHRISPARLLTTEMVLAELLAALAKPATRATVVKGVDRIRSDPNVEVVPQTSLQFARAYDRYRARPDQAWSLTDCAPFTLMEERGVMEALAHDHHFQQAGYRALLRED